MLLKVVWGDGVLSEMVRRKGGIVALFAGDLRDIRVGMVIGFSQSFSKCKFNLLIDVTNSQIVEN